MNCSWKNFHLLRPTLVAILLIFGVFFVFSWRSGRAGEGEASTEIESGLEEVSVEQVADQEPGMDEDGNGGFGDWMGRPFDEDLPEGQKPIPKTLVELMPNTTDTPAVKLVKANNEFAVKLYRQLIKEQDEQSNSGTRKSFCFSPYSIATVLQSIKVGTRGATEEELAKVMGLTISGDELHRGCRVLLYLVGQLGMNCGFNDEDPLEVKIANHFWLQKKEQGYVLPEFLQTLSRYYDCGLKEIDFTDHKKVAKQINEWVSMETKQYIPEILSPEDIVDPTFFVATNVVFFQGKWCDPFVTEDTRLQPFFDSDGKTKLGQVSMMSSTFENMNELAQVEEVSILRRPYFGGMAFVVILPPPGEKALEKLEASLSVEKLAKWMAPLKHTVLERLELPKFDIQSGFSLVETLKRLGVKKVFDPEEADFSGMASKDGPWNPLSLSKVLHRATIQVDEEGTIATAATIGMGMGGGSPKTSRFIANRPFLFLIVDEKTSSILFMGRYMGPEENAGR